MGEESDPDEDSPFGDMRALESGAALGLALAVASREKADAFLDAQTEIARLQKEHLHEQRGLLFSHLEWQRFSDLMRAGWQIVLAILGLIAFVAIITALWNASRADGLIVDAFSVPPSFEQKGVGGDVVASDITGRLSDIRARANANSYSFSRDVTNDRSNAIKVEIPDTGISIAEAWRYMRSWLGHERHVTGNLRENADGSVTLTTSLDGSGALSASGRPGDLARIEQSVAEKIFATFDPVNAINYLAASGRHREAYAAAERFASAGRTLLERADSYALLAHTGAVATGDLQKAVDSARVSNAIDPTLAVAHVMAGRYSFELGRAETTIAEDRIILTLNNADQPPSHQNGGFDEMKSQAAAQLAFLQGDFAHSANWNCARGCTFGGLLFSKSEVAARLHDVAGAKALLMQGIAAGNADPGRADLARLETAVAAGDWNAAVAAGKDAWAQDTAPSTDTSPRFLEEVAAVSLGPLLAVAEAHAGQFTQAHAIIERTPRDCVLCNTARGEVDVLEGNANGAAYWFARAIHDGPSLPFAYADWGAMLLKRGDLDGAIAKFEIANQKGPHFADPLELWGEALIAKNRSDLALAKFQEANQYASNWGRLHMKWGEALLWSGDRTSATKQFALASTLDLTQGEQAELARVRVMHG